MKMKNITTDKYSDRLTWKMKGHNNLTDIMTDLLRASDSDWVLDDGDDIILIYNTGWRDGNNAKSSDLGGYTLHNIDKLIAMTDLVSSRYGKDGHLGIKYSKDALKRRIKGDVLDDINWRNDYRPYNPNHDDWDTWVKNNADKILV